jgi:enterochelin esterase-like enzyme
MRPILTFLLAAHLAFAAEPDFPLTADSKAQPEVPKGTMIKDTYTAKEGSVFPGTQREYQIYLPAGHDKTKPAAFMVFQDGVIYQAPVVFDNLIAKKDIPPLIGLFIKPGVVPAANDNALPRFNRSYEYDSITPTYSQFLIHEFLPAIEAKHGLKLSSDPNHAAISGNSSGGICAFMVAWHRPDRFRRVFTGVGTYVGIHGADQLPVLVRKFEPKPLRVFLQSGAGDNNLYCGDWWMANQMMERSLTWAGYDVNHAWGEGGHNQKHASQIFPDVLRWLWRDWQTDIEVKANPKGESKWKGYEVVGDASTWEALPSLKDGGQYLQISETGAVKQTKERNTRAITKSGRSFNPPKGHSVLCPDQTFVYTSLYPLPVVSSAQVLDGGKAAHEWPFFVLQQAPHGSCLQGGMCVDAAGRLYVATEIGIQICDQAGRVNSIIPTPGIATDVCFGGKDLSELFIACGDTIYKRPTKAHGVVSGQQAPIKPAPPKL